MRNALRDLSLSALGMLLGIGLFFFFQSHRDGASIGVAPDGDRDLRVLASPTRHASLRAELLNRFGVYENDRSRRNSVLLDEIISAYLRADAQECFALLRSLDALFLVSPTRSTLGIATQIDLRDMGSALRIASESDPRIGDVLITESFKRQMEIDPEKAFAYLRWIPPHLRENMTAELARSWGKRDGPKAARAFSGSVNDVFPLKEALSAWAQVDAKSAFTYIASAPDLPGNSFRVDMMNHFLEDLTKTDPSGAISLLSETGKIEGLNYVDILSPLMRPDSRDPKAPLNLAKSLPSFLQANAYESIAEGMVASMPAVSIQAASQLPDTDKSLSTIKQAAKFLAQSSKDPYAISALQNDPYQHSAVVAGVSEGLLKKQGVDGLASAVQHGLESSDPEWLKAAAALIVSGKPPAAPKGKPAASWNALPPDVVAALMNYAATDWSPEQSTALGAQLQ